jgi:hypothetical protein
MRSPVALSVSLLLPLAAAGAQAGSGDRYVPSGIWRDAEDGDRYERWIGRFLRAMREPPLTSPQAREPFERRFRLVIIPDMRGAFRSLRVDQRRGGGARVRTVLLNRGRRYGPGSIAHEQVYDIDRDAVLEFTRALDMSRLVELPTEGPPPQGPVDISDDETVITICMHPTTYVFELVERHRRAYVLWRLVEQLGPLHVR